MLAHTERITQGVTTLHTDFRKVFSSLTVQSCSPRIDVGGNTWSLSKSTTRTLIETPKNSNSTAISITYWLKMLTSILYFFI